VVHITALKIDGSDALGGHEAVDVTLPGINVAR